MTHSEECAAVRREIYEAREAARKAEFAKPLALSIRHVLGARQQRDAQAQERGAARWGAPDHGGLSRPTANVGPRNRNTRYT